MSSEPRRPSRRRLLGIVAVAGFAVAVPAWATADQPPAAAPDPTTAGSPTRATGPSESRFPPTSTNVLVTSPPPTVAPPTTVAAQVVGRQWPVAIPDGCAEPALPDVVFVGTVETTDYRTARFRIDQLRAGAVDAFSADGLIDIRYGIDAKFLADGQQYLVGASLDPSVGVLVSKVAAAAPLFGGDQVIGRTESESECPELTDPVRTLLTNGRPVDSGIVRPMREASGSVVRSLALPLIAAGVIILGLVSFRWLVTGLGWSISRGLARSRPSAQPRRR